MYIDAGKRKTLEEQRQVKNLSLLIDERQQLQTTNMDFKMFVGLHLITSTRVKDNKPVNKRSNWKIKWWLVQDKVGTHGSCSPLWGGNHIWGESRGRVHAFSDLLLNQVHGQRELLPAQLAHLFSVSQSPAERRENYTQQSQIMTSIWYCQTCGLISVVAKSTLNCNVLQFEKTQAHLNYFDNRKAVFRKNKFVDFINVIEANDQWIWQWK